MTENFPMSWSCWLSIPGLVVAALGWIALEKQQQYWVTLLYAAESNSCSFYSFFHLNFKVLFLYCDSRVSPLKQILKALNGRVVALEELTDLRTVCLTPLRTALQFSQKQIDLGALSLPQWILVILLCCKLNHPFSKQQLFIFWTCSWLFFKIQVTYSHYKIFACNFRVEKDI